MVWEVEEADEIEEAKEVEEVVDVEEPNETDMVEETEAINEVEGANAVEDVEAVDDVDDVDKACPLLESVIAVFDVERVKLESTLLSELCVFMTELVLTPLEKTPELVVLRATLDDEAEDEGVTTPLQLPWASTLLVSSVMSMFSA